MLLVGLFLIFFAITLYRQAFGNTRKGDLDVFFRAGWAARFGADLYQVTDDHGWHYLYPPLLAGLMIPLADPPPDAPISERSYTLPFWLSASIWYWLNVFFVVASLHILASSLEAGGAASGIPPPPPNSRAWWALRTWPLLVTLFPLGDALGSGQVTALLLFAISCSVGAMLHGRNVVAGICIGLAAVVKVFPLYLILYPLLRGDRRMLAGVAVGMLVGLLLPVLLMGPKPSFEASYEFFVERLRDATEGHRNPVLAQETHGTTARIQSFEYMIYNALHPGRENRAHLPPTGYFIAHAAVSAVVTMGLLVFMRRRGDAIAEMLFFSTLILLTVPISPVSRPHYYALAAIVLAGLLAAEWPRHRGLWPGWPVTLAGLASVAAGLLAALNQHQAVDFGLATYVALGLSAVALAVARQRLTSPGASPDLSRAQDRDQRAS